MISLLSLGARLTRAGGRASIIRLSLLALGAALSCVAILFVAGMAAMTSAQVDQEERNDVSLTAFSEEPATFVGAEHREFWNGERLRRTVVADVDETTPAPPGVQRLPGPGEMVVSPALSDLIAEEPTLARRFNATLIGVIDDSGLASPADLVGYVGVERADLANAWPLSGFGVSGLGTERDPGATQVVALLLTALILLPITVFLSTCARLSARSRDQRLATLRLLGLSPKRTQLVNAVEVGIGGFVGAAIGAAGFLAWTRVADTASIGSLEWFVSDMAPSSFVVIASVVVVGATAIGVAAASSQAGISAPLATRRERAVRSVRARRVVPLLAGIALLAVSWQRAEDTPSAASWLPAFVAGMALTAIGLTIAAPFVSLFFGRILDRFDSGATMIASGRLRHDPGAGARLVSGLAVSIFALGFAFSVLEAFEIGGDSRSGDADLVGLTVKIPGTDPTGLEAIDETVTVSELRPYPSVPDPVVDGDFGDPRENGTILVADCTTFRDLSGTPASSCVEGSTYRIGADFDGDGTVDRMGGQEVFTPFGYPEPAGSLVVPPSQSIDMQITFLAPPGLDVPVDTEPEVQRDGATISTSRWLIGFDAASHDRAIAISAVVEQFPGADLSGFAFTVSSADLPTYRAMVSAGTISAIAIGILALAVATIDRSLERRRETARLAALGTPRRTLDIAHALHTIPVAATVVTLAVIGSGFGGAAYLRIGGEAGYGIPIPTLFLLASGALFGILAATGLGVITLRQTTGNSIRDE